MSCQFVTDWPGMCVVVWLPPSRLLARPENPACVARGVEKTGQRKPVVLAACAERAGMIETQRTSNRLGVNLVIGPAS